MKLLIALACLVLSSRPTPKFLVLDMEMKRPVERATQFTTEQFLQRCFPIYASDRDTIISATDNVVRQMEKEPAGFTIDTINTEHSMLLLIKDGGRGPNFSVTLMTKVEENQTSFAFAIVTKEVDKRKAQQKVLDFATYLNQ